MQFIAQLAQAPVLLEGQGHCPVMPHEQHQLTAPFSQKKIKNHSDLHLNSTGKSNLIPNSPIWSCAVNTVIPLGSDHRLMTN